MAHMPRIRSEHPPRPIRHTMLGLKSPCADGDKLQSVRTDQTYAAQAERNSRLARRRHMGPDLNLNFHPECEAGNTDAAQDGAVIWHVLPHVFYKVRNGILGDVGGVVQLHGVDVLPARAGLLECVLDVVERLVDLLYEVWLDLASLTVPAAYDYFSLSET